MAQHRTGLSIDSSGLSAQWSVYGLQNFESAPKPELCVPILKIALSRRCRYCTYTVIFSTTSMSLLLDKNWNRAKVYPAPLEVASLWRDQHNRKGDLPLTIGCVS